MSLKQIKDAKSLSELAQACRKLVSTLEKDVNSIAQDTSKKLLFRLIYETPVDTSQALSNWQVSLVFPTSTSRPAYKVGEAGSTKEVSAAKAYAKALQLIKQKKPRIDLIATNNLPYIHKLNFGGSKQQPALFVEKIIAQINTDAQATLRKYLNGN